MILWFTRDVETKFNMLAILNNYIILTTVKRLELRLEDTITNSYTKVLNGYPAKILNKF